MITIHLKPLKALKAYGMQVIAGFDRSKLFWKPLKPLTKAALKNMYKSYLKLKDMFEEMPQERIDEITGEKHEYRKT